jgi:hypothetical protein
MRIGIFGDSFANLKFEENTTPTWVDILSTKYSITNHALPGSNLYYSIDLIQKYHLEFDKIILVVTEPGRLKLSKWLSLEEQDQFVVGMSDSKVANLDNFKDNKKLAYEAAAQYFLYLQDNVYDNYIHELMLKDIVRSKEDIIFVPAFKNSWHGSNFSMHQIYLKENEYWNIDDDTIRNEYTDIRNCHMTAENNELFAIEAEKWLDGKPVHINLDDSVTTTNKDFYLKQK